VILPNSGRQGKAACRVRCADRRRKIEGQGQVLHPPRSVVSTVRTNAPAERGGLATCRGLVAANGHEGLSVTPET